MSLGRLNGASEDSAWGLNADRHRKSLNELESVGSAFGADSHGWRPARKSRGARVSATAASTCPRPPLKTSVAAAAGEQEAQASARHRIGRSFIETEVLRLFGSLDHRPARRSPYRDKGKQGLRSRLLAAPSPPRPPRRWPCLDWRLGLCFCDHGLFLPHACDRFAMQELRLEISVSGLQSSELLRRGGS
jgi:hypothetical protein